MGPAVVGTTGKSGTANGLVSLESPEVSTPDELESLHDKLISGELQNVSASFEPVPDHIEKATVQGDIKQDSELSSFQDRAKLQSFALKLEEGGAVRFSLADDTLSIHQYTRSNEEPNVELPEYQSVYLVAQVTLYAMYSVDRFIERNGLRPVVDEIKERRWVILVTCSILAIYF